MKNLFFHPLFIYLWSCLSQWGKTGAPSPHHRHHHRLLLMQSSGGWHFNYAFFKGNCKSPNRATSSWQQNWWSISLKRLQSLHKLCSAGEETSAGHGAGRSVQRAQRRAPIVHLSRGRTGIWGGWGWGANTVLRTRGHCSALLAS